MNDELVEEQLSASTGWENMIIGGYTALRTFGNMFGQVGFIVGQIALTMGIPKIFIQGFMIIFMISVIFILVYIVFRFMPRDD